MIGRNPRGELDVMIVKALKDSQSLRYKDLEEKINVRCQDLGLKKPSTATFSIHLANLCGRKSRYSLFIDRKVLHKELREDRSTHYSLTKEFKDAIDIQKKKYPTTDIEETLSLRRFRGYRD